MQINTERTSISDERKFKEVNKVIIQIGDVRYRINENQEGGLCINKTCMEGNSIQITPRVSNEIYLK